MASMTSGIGGSSSLWELKPWWAQSVRVPLFQSVSVSAMLLSFAFMRVLGSLREHIIDPWLYPRLAQWMHWPPPPMPNTPNVYPWTVLVELTWFVLVVIAVSWWSAQTMEALAGPAPALTAPPCLSTNDVKAAMRNMDGDRAVVTNTTFAPGVDGSANPGP